MVSLRSLKSRALHAMWRIATVLVLQSSRRNLLFPVRYVGPFALLRKTVGNVLLSNGDLRTGIKLIFCSFHKAPVS